MSAWSANAWFSTAWYSGAWASVTTTPSVSWGRGKYRRKWKTTEEILNELRAEREWKYLPIPEQPSVSIAQIVRTDLDYEAIATKLVNQLIERQAEFERKVLEKKRKKAISLMLLDS